MPFRQDKIKGTASAASIWNTGCIGMAVAQNRLEIAMALSALNFLILKIIAGPKRQEEEGSKAKAGVKGQGHGPLVQHLPLAPDPAKLLWWHPNCKT